MGLSVRVYCYEPSGQLRSVSMSVASALQGVKAGERVAIPQFANCTIQFAQFVIEMQERKPVDVTMECYHVYRFDKDGVADSLRYIQEAVARMSSLHGSDMPSGVVDARGEFASRGRDWAPSISEKKELFRAALGEVKVPRLTAVTVHTLDECT